MNFPPAYNSGTLLETILTANDLAVYSSSFGECAIVIQFVEGGAEITQIITAFDCGFGHAVYADAFYPKVDDERPKLRCLGLLGPNSDLCEK